MKRAILCAVVCLLFLPARAQTPDTNPMEEVVKEVYSLINRYTKQLFPFHDPFAKVFDLETGEAVFARLKVRKNSDGSTLPAPLARLSTALITFHAHKTLLDENFVHEIVDDSKAVLESQQYKRHDRQSNLLALYYLLDYLRRFNVDVTPKESEKETNKQDKEKKQKKEKPQEKQKPTYPKMANSYKPHTKDTKKEPGSKEDQVVIAEVNFPTAYFGQRYFSEIVRGAAEPFQEVNLPTSFASPSTARSTSHAMTVHLLGETEAILFLPPGHSPYQPTDPRAQISRNHAGGYVLKIDDASLDNIQVPLEQVRAETLQAHIREIYTRPVGFDFDEWPAAVRTDLFHRYDPKKDYSENPLPLADLMMPNLDEAEVLTGFRVRSVEDMRRAARGFYRRFSCAVLVKGGHLRGAKRAADIFYDGTTELLLTAPFVRGIKTHGTGCTCSTAFTFAPGAGAGYPDRQQSRARTNFTSLVQLRGHEKLPGMMSWGLAEAKQVEIAQRKTIHPPSRFLTIKELHVNVKQLEIVFV